MLLWNPLKILSCVIRSLNIIPVCFKINIRLTEFHSDTMIGKCVSLKICTFLEISLFLRNHIESCKEFIYSLLF